MNQELIERAAASYADSIPQFDDRKRYCREDFIAGADWRINSVWHNLPNDLPKKENTLILLELMFEGRLVYLPVEWVNDEEGAPYQATRWAYIDDLLPERKEETV